MAAVDFVCHYLNGSLQHVQIKCVECVVNKKNLPSANGATCSSDGSSNRSLIVNLLSYFSFQLVLHNWCLWDGAYKISHGANWKKLI